MDSDRLETDELENYGKLFLVYLRKLVEVRNLDDTCVGYSVEGGKTLFSLKKGGINLTIQNPENEPDMAVLSISNPPCDGSGADALMKQLKGSVRDTGQWTVEHFSNRLVGGDMYQ